MAGDDLAKFADFQRQTLSLVGHFIYKISALRARPLSYHNLNELIISERETKTCLSCRRKMMGNDFAKIADFQRKQLSLVYDFM